ncbi:signal peptidase [Kaistella flava (ex Peng et al. 2021)]|uniref:Signal peptidase n=1 Tax=Kaistella flava (ex Peng et al. 2021) TaxID=2038776 RepID=A0A7M2YCM6_9FLAO|nr:signal peptidase [Kaistella flava (ex Peng et al. 2021)]
MLFLILGSLMYADSGPVGPPSPPPGGGNNGGGTSGPGGLASPIDMYIYILAIAAILFIVLYAKKVQNKQTV